MTTFQAMGPRLPLRRRELADFVADFLVGDALVAVDVDRLRHTALAVGHDELGDLAVDRVLDRAKQPWHGGLVAQLPGRGAPRDALVDDDPHALRGRAEAGHR